MGDEYRTQQSVVYSTGSHLVTNPAHGLSVIDYSCCHSTTVIDSHQPPLASKTPPLVSSTYI